MAVAEMQDSFVTDLNYGIVSILENAGDLHAFRKKYHPVSAEKAFAEIDTAKITAMRIIEAGFRQTMEDLMKEKGDVRESIFSIIDKQREIRITGEIDGTTLSEKLDLELLPAEQWAEMFHLLRNEKDYSGAIEVWEKSSNETFRNSSLIQEELAEGLYLHANSLFESGQTENLGIIEDLINRSEAIAMKLQEGNYKSGSLFTLSGDLNLLKFRLLTKRTGNSQIIFGGEENLADRFLQIAINNYEKGFAENFSTKSGMALVKGTLLEAEYSDRKEIRDHALKIAQIVRLAAYKQGGQWSRNEEVRDILKGCNNLLGKKEEPVQNETLKKETDFIMKKAFSFDHLTLLISGNIKNNKGILAETIVSDWDYELGLKVIESLGLSENENYDDFEAVVNEHLRERFHLKNEDDEYVDSEARTRIHNSLVRLNEAFLATGQADSATNVMMNYVLGIGDCREMAKAKMVLFEVWRNRNADRHLRKALDLINVSEGDIFEQELIKAKEILRARMALIDTEVTAQILTNEKGIPIKSESGEKKYWIYKPNSKLTPIETHQFPVLYILDANMQYIENLKIKDPRYKKAWGLNGNGEMTPNRIIYKGIYGKNIHVFDPISEELIEIPTLMPFDDKVYRDREFSEPISIFGRHPKIRGFDFYSLN